MAILDIKDSSSPEIKRLIISMDNDNINTVGFKVNKKELYQLYTYLREMFKDVDK